MPRRTGERGHGANTCAARAAMRTPHTPGVTHPPHTRSVLHLSAHARRPTATTRTTTPKSWMPPRRFPLGRHPWEQGTPLAPHLPGAAAVVNAGCGASSFERAAATRHIATLKSWASRASLVAHRLRKHDSFPVLRLPSAAARTPYSSRRSTLPGRAGVTSFTLAREAAGDGTRDALGLHELVKVTDERAGPAGNDDEHRCPHGCIQDQCADCHHTDQQGQDGIVAVKDVKAGHETTLTAKKESTNGPTAIPKRKPNPRPSLIGLDRDCGLPGMNTAAAAHVRLPAGVHEVTQHHDASVRPRRIADKSRPATNALGAVRASVRRLGSPLRLKTASATAVVTRASGRVTP